MDLTNLTESDKKIIIKIGIQSMRNSIINYVDELLGIKGIDYDTKESYCKILTKVFGEEDVIELNKGKYKK